MPPKTIDIRGMGADALDAAAAQADLETQQVNRNKSLLRESCVECGTFGPWSDGEFYYCDEHVPHHLRHRGAFWRRIMEKYDGTNAAELLDKFKRDIDP